MIKPGEIQQYARKTSVRDTQIEKDYILTWILYGISKHVRLSKALAFKGGTVLKKVYFEDYRYSEDLDFTLLDEALSNEEIFSDFRQIFEMVKKAANIILPLAEDAEHDIPPSPIMTVLHQTNHPHLSRITVNRHRHLRKLPYRRRYGSPPDVETGASKRSINRHAGCNYISDRSSEEVRVTEC